MAKKANFDEPRKFVQYKEHNIATCVPKQNPKFEPIGSGADKPDDPLYQRFSNGNYRTYPINTEAEYNGSFEEDDDF